MIFVRREARKKFANGFLSLGASFVAAAVAAVAAAAAAAIAAAAAVRAFSLKAINFLELTGNFQSL